MSTRSCQTTSRISWVNVITLKHVSTNYIPAKPINTETIKQQQSINNWVKQQQSIIDCQTTPKFFYSQWHNSRIFKSILNPSLVDVFLFWSLFCNFSINYIDTKTKGLATCKIKDIIMAHGTIMDSFFSCPPRKAYQRLSRVITPHQWPYRHVVILEKLLLIEDFRE